MKLFLRLTLLLAALPAAAQTVDATFASPTSLYEPASLYDLGPAQADGKRLLLGSFTRTNNTPTGGVVRLDASGALDQPFTQNAGLTSHANAVRPGLNGQYLLGSGYDGTVAAGGLGRYSVLRLNADGTGDATFDAGSGPAVTPGNNNAPYTGDFAVQPDGKVLVGGVFDRYSGAVAGGLVRLTSSGSVDAGFATGTGAIRDGRLGEVRTLLVLPNGQVLAGGYFSTFNGQAVSSLVRLNANGSVDTTLPTVFDVTSFITGLVLQPDGKILVRGYLVKTGNTTFNTLLRLLPSGALDTSFTADPSVDYNLSIAFGRAQLALQADGRILLAGTSSSTGISGLTRLTTTGSLDASFAVTGAPSASPFVVGVQPSGKILVGTDATNLFSGTQESSLGQYTSTGSFDATYLPKLQAPSTVLTVARQPDGSLLAGGYFTEWNGQPVHRVVRLSATGTLDVSFTTQAGVQPGGVRSLVVQPDGRLVLGTGAGVRRLAASGAPDASFTSALGSVIVNKLALQPDGKLLVGGSFSQLPGGINTSALVRLSSTGALDASFTLSTASPGKLGYVGALLLQPDGRVVAAGYQYGATNNPDGYYVARYESTGAQDITFTPQLTDGGVSYGGPVYALAQQADGKLLLGGDFAKVGTTARPGLARLNTNGTPDASFVPSSQFLGFVYSLAVQPNGRVLVGGKFTPAGSSAGANLTRVLTTGQPDASFSPTATPSDAVYDLLIQPDGGIALAGAFTLLNNQPRLALARITAPNVLAVAAPAPTAARTSAWPVPAHELLHVAPDPTTQPQLAELLDALGRPVRRLPLTSAAEFTLPTVGLPAGLYLLRVTYATGAVSRQVAVE